MGARNVNEAIEQWDAAIGGRLALRLLLTFMASASSDTDNPPVYWGGNERLRRLLGGIGHRALMRNMAKLVDMGAIVRVERGRPGRNARYALVIDRARPQPARTGGPYGPQQVAHTAIRTEVNESKDGGDAGSADLDRRPCGRTHDAYAACRKCGDLRRAGASDRAESERANRDAAIRQKYQRQKQDIDGCPKCDGGGRLPGGAVCPHSESVEITPAALATLEAAGIHVRPKGQRQRRRKG